MNFEEQKVIEGLDEVQKLKKLFLFYSNNEKLISSQKFKKLIEDAGIIDSNFDYHYSDTIFHKKGNKIEFDSFCDILVKISKIKYPSLYKQNEMEALQKIIYENFLPLYENISERNFLTPVDKLNINNLYVYMESKQFIESIRYNYLILMNVYKKYFPWENMNISTLQKKENSEKSLNKFLSTFDICPNLISLLRVKEIFENIISNTNSFIQNFAELEENNYINDGTYFTFYHFMASLFFISAIAYFDGSHIKKAYATRKIGGDFTNIANLSCFEEILKKLFTSLKINEILDNKVYTKNFLTKEREKIFSQRDNDLKKYNFGQSNFNAKVRI